MTDMLESAKGLLELTDAAVIDRQPTRVNFTIGENKYTFMPPNAINWRTQGLARTLKAKFYDKGAMALYADSDFDEMRDAIFSKVSVLSDGSEPKKLVGENLDAHINSFAESEREVAYIALLFGVIKVLLPEETENFTKAANQSISEIAAAQSLNDSRKAESTNEKPKKPSKKSVRQLPTA